MIKEDFQISIGDPLILGDSNIIFLDLLWEYLARSFVSSLVRSKGNFLVLSDLYCRFFIKLHISALLIPKNSTKQKTPKKKTSYLKLRRVCDFIVESLLGKS